MPVTRKPAHPFPGLAEVFPADRCFVDDAHLAAYESDGLTAFKARPRAVVVPGSRPARGEFAEAFLEKYAALD